MLDYLRRKAQSPVLQVTILVIILVFIFWGTNMGRGSRRDAAALVNGQAISFSEFNQEYNRSMDQLREQFNGALPKGLLEKLGMKQQVLGRLIQRTLLLQGANNLGLYVSNGEVQKKVQSQPAFKLNGKFDNERYKQILASNRLSPQKYEAGLRQDMLAQKVRRELAGFATASAWELTDRLAFAQQEIKLTYARFNAEQFKDKVEVDDAALTAWYAKHQEDYKTPPEVKLDYLLFNQGDYKATISVMEAQKYYELHQKQYQHPEQRRASHILLRQGQEGNQAKMADIRRRALAGEDFASLAKQFSQDPGSARLGGDLGFFGRGQMVPAFEQAVFSLQPGEISTVIKSKFGLHLIKLNEIKPASTTPFAEVKDNIIATLQAEQAKAVAFEKAGEAYEKIFQAGSLAKFTKKEGVDLHHTEFFKQSAPPAQLATLGSALINQAFSLAKGELSSLLETSTGYAIISINDQKAPVIPELATVQGQVRTDYISAQALGLAKKAATSCLAQLKAGEDFNTSVAAVGTQAQTTPFFSRQRVQDAGVPQDLAQKAFTLSTRHPLPESPLAQGSNFYVYTLLAKKQGESSLTSSQKTILHTRLNQEKQQRLMENWLAFLRNKSEISTNKKFMAQR